MEKLAHQALDLFGVHLTGRHILALLNYERLLLEWNQKHNLTAIRDTKGIRTKHFLDSFSCILSWKANPPTSLVDVGTGAGLPGIPLKILYPAMQVTLVESVGKKAKFCQHVIEKLGLEGIDVQQARAEDLGQTADHREQYDWAVARAVAKVRVLVEYLLPLVKIGGTMLAQKGENAPAETQSAEDAISVLGGHVRQLHPVTLPGVTDQRYLVLVDKVAATPSTYPRKRGVPTKQPL
jgi:16S rRNA (guanine527-N7)-methyltransferase